MLHFNVSYGRTDIWMEQGAGVYFMKFLIFVGKITQTDTHTNSTFISIDMRTKCNLHIKIFHKAQVRLKCPEISLNRLENS